MHCALARDQPVTVTSTQDSTHLQPPSTISFSICWVWQVLSWVVLHRRMSHIWFLPLGSKWLRKTEQHHIHLACMGGPQPGTSCTLLAWILPYLSTIPHKCTVGRGKDHLTQFISYINPQHKHSVKNKSCPRNPKDGTFRAPICPCSCSFSFFSQIFRYLHISHRGCSKNQNGWGCCSVFL